MGRTATLSRMAFGSTGSIDAFLYLAAVDFCIADAAGLDTCRRNRAVGDIECQWDGQDALTLAYRAPLTVISSHKSLA